MMKKLFTCLIALVLFSSIGWAQEKASPRKAVQEYAMDKTASTALTATVWSGDNNIVVLNAGTTTTQKMQCCIYAPKGYRDANNFPYAGFYTVNEQCYSSGLTYGDCWGDYTCEQYRSWVKWYTTKGAVYYRYDFINGQTMRIRKNGSSVYFEYIGDTHEGQRGLGTQSIRWRVGTEPTTTSGSESINLWGKTNDLSTTKEYCFETTVADANGYTIRIDVTKSASIKSIKASEFLGYNYKTWLKKNGSLIEIDDVTGKIWDEGGNTFFEVCMIGTNRKVYNVTNYAPQGGTLTVTAGANGQVKLDGGEWGSTFSNTYEAGESVTIEAKANDGCVFSKWNDNAPDNPRTITVNGDASYTATFMEVVELNMPGICPFVSDRISGKDVRQVHAYNVDKQVILTIYSSSLSKSVGNLVSSDFCGDDYNYYADANNNVIAYLRNGMGTLSEVPSQNTDYPYYVFDCMFDGSDGKKYHVKMTYQYFSNNADTEEWTYDQNDAWKSCTTTQKDYGAHLTAYRQKYEDEMYHDDYLRLRFHFNEGKAYIPTNLSGYILKNEGTDDFVYAYYARTQYTDVGPEESWIDRQQRYSGFTGEYDWFPWYLCSGKVKVLNPNQASQPMYLRVEGYNSYGKSAIAQIGSIPALRTVAIKTSTYGSVQVNSREGIAYGDGGNKYYEGTILTLTPTNTGAVCVGFEGIDTEKLTKNADGTFSFVVEAQDYELTPIFEQAKDGVITVVATNGSVKGTITEENDFKSGTKYDANTTITLTAEGNDEYMFYEWQDNHSKEPTRTIVVNGDTTYTAVFKHKYQVTVTSSDDTKGTVSISPAPVDGYYYDGQEITLTATPANIFISFVKWQKNGTDIAGGTTMNVTVNASDSYVAVFEDIEVTKIDIQAAMTDNHGWGWGYCFYYWAKTYGYDIQIIGADDLVYTEGADFGIDEINTSKSYINDHGTKVTFTSFAGSFYTENSKKVLETIAQGSNGKTYWLKLRGKTADSDDAANDYNQTYSSLNKALTHKGDNIWQASSQNGTGQTYSETWCNHFFFKVDPSKQGDIPSGIYPLDDSQATGTLISTSGSSYQSNGTYFVQSYVYYVPASGYAEVINTGGTYYVKFEGYNSRGYNYTVTIGTKPAIQHTITFDESVTVMNGSTTVNSGDKVDEGAVLTITATADPGYHFSGWTNEAITTTSGTGVVPVVGSFTVGSADATLGATFEKDKYTITVDATTNGSIVIIDEMETELYNGKDGGTIENVEYGTELTLTAVPDEHYALDSWTITPAENYEEVGMVEPDAPSRRKISMEEIGGDIEIGDVGGGGEGYTIMVKGALTIGATFEKEKYTIKFMNGDTELQSSQVEYGEKPEYTGATPTRADSAEFSFTFKSWTPKIVAATAAATYTATFTKVENFALIDNKAEGDEYYTTLANKKGNKMNITYQRSFTEGTWAVVSLPFDYSFLNAANTTFKGMVYSLVDVQYTTSGVLTLSCMPSTAKMTANQPYIIIPTANISNPVFNNITLKAIADKSYTVENSVGKGSVTFHNTQVVETLNKGDKTQVYISSNKLYYPSSTKTTKMRAFSGYFLLNMEKEDIHHAPIRMVNAETGAEITLEQDGEVAEETTKKYIENGVLVIERNGVKYNAQGALIEK